MDDTDVLSGFQSMADLLNDFDRFERRELLFSEDCAKVLAFDNFHADEFHTVGTAQIVDPDHVFVSHHIPRF